MSFHPNLPLRIEVIVGASKPELLQGLDVWLSLGLITDIQVKQLSRKYLTCELPEIVISEVGNNRDEMTDDSEFSSEEIFVSEEIQPGFFKRIWQSFKNELSVRWLLFLGVFLIILSSGVMAATQWTRFPATLQYGVLWAYTMLFWGAGLKATQQPNLALTAKTLQTISLLLIPVNFWAMDSFGLWSKPWQWLIVAIAAVSLTYLTLWQSRHTRWLKTKLLTANLLALSYLQWGWQVPKLPLVAVYLGMIGTSLIVLRLHSPVAETTGNNATQTEQNRGQTETGLIFYALAILLIRAIFVHNLALENLGLAIGICGWLIADQGLRIKAIAPREIFWVQSRIWQGVGCLLLLCGWLVSMAEIFPWQATLVSFLALQFFRRRLQIYWLPRDLLAIFGISFQLIFLLRELLPSVWRGEVMMWLIQISDGRAFPDSVYGVLIFPYIICCVTATEWLYRQSKSELALFGEWLTLGLGIILALLSLLNPTWRTLNFFLSTITLTIVTSRRLPIRFPLVYLTHAMGLLTLISGIDFFFPQLSQSTWAIVLIALTVIQLSLSTRLNFYSRSCWHLGCFLAGISYVVLIAIPEENLWGLLWLLIPFTLTGVASSIRNPRRQKAAWLSILFLIMVQILTVWQPVTRLIGLGMATWLTLVNTRYLKHPWAAIINLGFALTFALAIFWGTLSTADWFMAGAIAILTLWLTSSLLQRHTGTLAQIYAQASARWGLIICSWELLLLSSKCILSYIWIAQANSKYILTCIILGAAIIYHYWNSPRNRAIWGLSCAVEIVAAEGILLAQASVLQLATVNITLAFVSFGITNWLIKKESPWSRLISCPRVPLLYILLGIGLRLGYFSATTGLLTLGAAIIGLALGSRHPSNKLISYLSLGGISLGSYEVVIYQLQKASGGSLADGFSLLALVTAAIALVYRLASWYWHSRDKNQFLNLTLEEINFAAHSHWALASILQLISISLSVDTSPNLTILGIAVSLILAAYALIQARNQEEISQSNRNANLDWWVYVGLVKLFSSVIYARLIWSQLALLDSWRVIIACGFALLLYQLPWRNWGWQHQPWHRASIVLPALVALVTSGDVSGFSLICVALFYARIAYSQSQIRWTYPSLFFLNWAAWQWLAMQQFSDPLWYASFAGLSILYIAQVDSGFTIPQNRRNRHQLRILGSTIICLVALLFHQDTGIIPAFVALVAIFSGLAWRIRAFLYVGTLTFVLTASYQLLVLSFEYPLTKWILGLIVGIIFISLAANFEQRREQIENWLSHLRDWQ